MKITQLIVLGLSSLMIVSCTSTKKLKKSEADNKRLDSMYRVVQSNYTDCREQHAGDLAKIQSLEDQLNYAKTNNNQILGQMKDLSVISGTQAESIKKSLDNIGAKDSYIQNLQAELAHKDSLNMALVMNLKGALADVNDQDINIKVDKGVVYIDISDKLLFNSGKWDVTPAAKTVLGKVATVLKAQPDIEFMVEGHTDNKPYDHPGAIKDNWDLSTKRATSVVRILQKEYGLDPARITAAGRGEYLPVAANDTNEGRAANRRTRIVILPQLDQFFKLLEHK